MFIDHDQFQDLQSGAHRKPGINFRTPALIWHLGIWNPLRINDPELGASRDGDTDPHSERKDFFDKIILRIVQNIGFVQILESPNFFKDSSALYLFRSHINENCELIETIPPLSNLNNVSIKFKWKNIDCTLKFSLNTEYFTITSVLDLSEIPIKSNRKLLSDKLLKNDNFIDQSINTCLNYVLSDTDSTQEELARANKYLYTDVWQIFSRGILRITSDFEKFQYPPSGVFADFRAIAVQEDSKEDLFLFDRNFLMPGHHIDDKQKTPARETDHIFEKEEPLDIWWHDKMVKLWPFIDAPIVFESSGHKIDPTNREKKKEYTASLFLNKRALYISNLGAQSIDNKTFEKISDSRNKYASSKDTLSTSIFDESHHPLKYFVYVRPMKRWQTSRLIESINHLGTVRLAAFIHFRDLRLAGYELRVIEHLIQKSEKIVSSMNMYNEKLYNEYFSSIQERLLDLEEDSTLDQSKGKKSRYNLNGGLSYRVERSRYYVKQFVTELPFLRINRLEGFQPYDQFVQRRLGAIFDYIDRLGIRYGRVKRDRERLIALSQLRKSNERIEAISNIQKIGDVALFVILIPYYAGYTLKQFFFEKSTNKEGSLEPASFWSDFVAPLLDDIALHEPVNTLLFIFHYIIPIKPSTYFFAMIVSVSYYLFVHRPRQRAKKARAHAIKPLGSSPDSL